MHIRHFSLPRNRTFVFGQTYVLDSFKGMKFAKLFTNLALFAALDFVLIYLMDSNSTKSINKKSNNNQCDKKCIKHKLRLTNMTWCNGVPGFKDPPGPKVALASYPGSGNTWVRYLLQQLSGVLTGSIYKDRKLKKGGFPAEGIDDGSVIAIKTHELPCMCIHVDYVK